MRVRHLVVLALSVCLGSLLIAQQQPAAEGGGNVTQVSFQMVKPGMQQQYEAGRKRHMEWHRAQKDTWTWYVYEILTGENAGSYVSISPGHGWSDFDGRDQFNAGDGANVQATMGATTAGSSSSYYEAQPTMSTKAPGGAPAKMLLVNHLFVKPEGLQAYRAAVERVVETIKRNPKAPRRSTFHQLITGGEGPRFVQTLDRDSFAEIGSAPTPLSLLEGVVSKEEAAAMWSEPGKHVSHTRSELLQYRPDLSYVPAGR